MLYRKIAKSIESHLTSNSDKIMLIDGARQIGKTYIIRYVINKLYTNVIEINMLEDQLGNKLFENVKTISDFYLSISMIAGEKMKDKENTIMLFAKYKNKYHKEREPLLLNLIFHSFFHYSIFRSSCIVLKNTFITNFIFI